jgi:AbrB family looped-hinge helix DNA binding protein
LQEDESNNYAREHARMLGREQKMTVLTSVKVSNDFRVTIPKKIRKLLKIEEGDEIVFFTVEGMAGRVCFRKATSSYLRAQMKGGKG